MITRQRALLRLLANEGGEVSKLRLVKLSFLLRESSKRTATSSVYEFLPYQFGPYSFTLNHELRALERDGWLRVLETNIVAKRGLSAEICKLDNGFGAEIDALTKSYARLSTDEVVQEVYKNFPWYTALAKIGRRRAATIPTAECAVYTVGYEGMMLDGLLDLLLRSGIKRLVDVRCNPVARRFGFHKSTLDRHCRDVGIAYVHIPELGIPSSWRSDLSGLASYEELFVRYENEVLPASESWIETASELVREKPSAFMCMEADGQYCHRTRLAKVVAARTGLALQELRLP